MLTVVMATVDVSGIISMSITSAQTQAPSAAAPGPALKTPWGEPDLQGIWTDENDTPLQRPAKYADQEFFTAAQRAEWDKVRSGTLADVRAKRGTEADVAGTDTGGSQGGRRRTGVPSCPVASDGNMQVRQAAVPGREIRSDAIAATRGT